MKQKHKEVVLEQVYRQEEERKKQFHHRYVSQEHKIQSLFEQKQREREMRAEEEYLKQIDKEEQVRRI
jgi:hypothetical protein